MDSQLIEVMGRNILKTTLMRLSHEVATPERDLGIDLIYYHPFDGQDHFIARPVQMKASLKGIFSIHQKYAKFKHMAIAYVWNVADPANAEIYLMSYQKALEIAEQMGYTKTLSWKKNKAYTTTRPSKRLKALLEEYKL